MGCGKSIKLIPESIVNKPRNSIEIASEQKPTHEEEASQTLAKQSKVIPAHFVIENPGRISNYYSQGVKLGDGPTGFVRVAIHKSTGTKRAIKSLEKSKFPEDECKNIFNNEISMLKKTDHPNIVKLFESYEDGTYFHIVTEFLPGGELFDYLIERKSLTEPIAAHFMKQILSAVSYLHENNIVHRDIVPENLLLDSEANESILKLIDFGNATTIENGQKLLKKYGKAFYIAPEIIGNEGYDEKCDVWSCGVIFYILLCGQTPFYGKKDEEIIKKVLAGEYSLSGPVWANVSDEAIRLLKKMLEKNPKRRISASKALQDPWFASPITNSLHSSQTISASFINLRNLRTEQKLQNAVVAFIGSNLLSKEESKLMYENFRKIDKNGDGKLSRDELLEAYCEIMKKEQAIEEVKQIMNAVDSNNSGFIDYSEFISACVKKQHLINNEILEISFKTFDFDNNGKISALELKKILGSTDSDEEFLNTLISKVDKNGDGEIDLNEFKQMMIEYYENNV